MPNFVEEIGNKKKVIPLTILPEVILPNDPENESGENKDPMVVIAKAEKRARAEQRKNPLKYLHGNDRHYAKLLHGEADQLHLRGDYEAALVLYHKAASICPRDSSHSVAARRTMAAISSAANPSPALRKLLPKARNGAELSATLCPQAAAIRAENILKQSTDPSAVIPEILRYFDQRNDFWKLSPAKPSNMALRLSRSQVMQRQLMDQTKSNLSSLRTFFKAGDFKSTLKIGQELISLASGLQSPHKYLVEAHHYLALIYVSVRRHDRAVNNVSQMISAARASGDAALFTKSLVTLGVVHVSFDHLDAVCRAWEFLFPEVQDPVPQAWMLHEMGRCHLERGRFTKALKLSIRCQETAKKVNSQKWYLHGKLLSGQSLLKLGRFDEAFEALKVSAKITEEEGDTPTLSYIQDLINQVSRILRHSVLNAVGESVPSKVGASIDSWREKPACVEGEILKDHRRLFRDAFQDKMLKKPDNEISSIKSDDLPREDDHSITTSTHVLVNRECDLDSNNTDETYVIPKDQNQIFTGNSHQDEKPFHSEINRSFSQPNRVLSQQDENFSQPDFFAETKFSLESSQNDSGSEFTDTHHEIRNLFEQISATNKTKDPRDVSRLRVDDDEEEEEEVELLSEELEGIFEFSSEELLREEKSKSLEKKFEVDTDWRLEFVKSAEEVEDLLDATESIQTGRTYSLAATHALYHHSLPSSPR